MPARGKRYIDRVGDGETYLYVYDVANYPIWQEVLHQLFANGTNTFACRQQIDNPLCIAWNCPQTLFLQPVIWRRHIFGSPILHNLRSNRNNG